MNKITKKMLKSIKKYQLISPNDKVAVALSGGKDSLLCLKNLYEINRYIIKDFSIHAMTIDLGFNAQSDYTQIKNWCDSKNIPYSIKRTNIKRIVFDVRKEHNPCALCSKMRGAALHDLANLHNCNKIALGHHLDDIIETFMMNLLNEGRIGCFKPKTYLSRKDLTLIRPMWYVKETEILGQVKNYEKLIAKNPCPADKNSDRSRIKNYLNALEMNRHGTKERIFTAIQKHLIDNAQ